MASETLIIGDVGKLSKRCAKKRAYQYRGGRRGQWYAKYLAGDTASFMVAGRRLVRMPRFGKPQVVTVHSASVAEALGRMVQHFTTHHRITMEGCTRE